MKARVKPGARYGSAREGEIVDVPAHKLLIVPWCLEAADEREDAPPAAPSASEQPKSHGKKRR